MKPTSKRQRQYTHLTHQYSEDNRKSLAPFKGQRLPFEGVLIEILKPHRANAYSYGLVFASIYAPHHDVEIDHIIIKIPKRDYKTRQFHPYTRYYFTAEVGVYYKTVKILGTPAKQEHFMLCNINMARIEQIKTSKLTQPTLYTKNRIKNILINKKNPPEHTESELIDIVTTIDNDGSAEAYIDQYSRRQRQGLTAQNIKEKLYQKQE